MVDTGDHMLDVFRNRDDPAAREAYVQIKEKEADERKAKKRKAKKPANARKKKRLDLFSLELPKSVTAGETLLVKLNHKVAAELGEQSVHVTLKAGSQGKRLERKVVKVSGQGVVEVTFDVPATVADNTLHVAAFIGEDYAGNMQHLQSDPLPVR